jgi:ribosome-binding factor A
VSASPFLRRVNERIREVVAEEVERLKDPGLGFVTVTGVDTAPDLRSARVYYSVLGDDTQHEETEAALGRASKRLRSVVGRRVRLKYVPELRFEPDTAIEHGMRIEEILRELREERGEGGDSSADQAGG